MTRAYIGVGSNIDPARHIPQALVEMARLVRVSGISTFYRTRPLYGVRQPPYANGVVQVETSLTARSLHRELSRIERRLGRRRGSDPNASRPIDLDLLLHGRTVRLGDALPLPSPDILSRNFVYQPLLELTPSLRLPGSSELLRRRVDTRNRAGMRPIPSLTRRLLTVMAASQRPASFRRSANIRAAHAKENAP